MLQRKSHRFEQFANCIKIFEGRTSKNNNNYDMDAEKKLGKYDFWPYPSIVGGNFSIEDEHYGE